ncbi:MAG: molybdenum cofactor biosynthesis protein MoaE [Neomegalonema sp.]|nr:molybdenum cofactor biosynthesis protein MoaE [Neomegalonema sp.]
MSVCVQTEDFSIEAEIAALSAGRGDIGAVVSFTGLVRDNGGALRGMELEHYPGMTEKALQEIHDHAVHRWSLDGARIIHRVGPLAPGERIVLVLAASRHRQDAFEAASFMMDFLKTRAPFWKKETGADGQAHWVDARESDESAAALWLDDEEE